MTQLLPLRHNTLFNQSMNLSVFIEFIYIYFFSSVKFFAGGIVNRSDFINICTMEYQFDIKLIVLFPRSDFINICTMEYQFDIKLIVLFPRSDFINICTMEYQFVCVCQQMFTDLSRRCLLVCRLCLH